MLSKQWVYLVAPAHFLFFYFVVYSYNLPLLYNRYTAKKQLKCKGNFLARPTKLDASKK